MSILLNPWLELVHDHAITYVTSTVDMEQQKPIFPGESIYLWHKADFDQIKSQVINLIQMNFSPNIANRDATMRPFGMHDFKSIYMFKLS